MASQRQNRAIGSARFVALATFAVAFPGPWAAHAEEPPARRVAEEAMRRAAAYFHGEVASHGGYVYYYSLDLQTRWGEGPATADQIWVQPPGTPTVGMAYLDAYSATGDAFYLDAATDAAEALLYGQLRSGGWTNAIDFDPRGQRVAAYRNGKGQGRNYSTLDDGITQAALRLLMHIDRAHRFEHREVHEAAQVALDALLAAQFPNGGFPQVWDGPVAPRPVRAARYPEHDWRTDGRIKNYWDHYTLNDNVAGTTAGVLIDADAIYDDPRYAAALRRLGDFLLLAQMPAPQPAWAQQYDDQMQPIWARKFEPPAIASAESQDVLRTLVAIHQQTGDAKYLEPIPRTIAYLQRSLLPDGRLARYYELRTNRPLYMRRQGDLYSLTYDDSDLPGHYGWKVPSEIGDLRRALRAARGRSGEAERESSASLAEEAGRVVERLDGRGRWISEYDGERLTGQPKFAPGDAYLSSNVFSRNLGVLSRYLAAADRSPGDSE